MFTRKKTLLFLFVAVLGLMIPATSRAYYTVVYNNFGHNDSYSSGGIALGLNGQSVADRFTSSSSGTLYGLALGAVYGSGNNIITLSLLSYNAGKLGSTLWSETFTNQLGSPGSVLNVDNLGGPMLSIGSSYWLLASTDSTSWQAWGYANTNMGGELAVVYNNGNPTMYENYLTGSTSILAMSVTVGNASPSPIPSTVWLFGSGLAGLFGLKRKYLG